jgi:hypothetical protein
LALTSYLARTKDLLQNPAAPTGLYADADLTTYINEARVQVAGESQAIRVLGSLTLTAGVGGPYPLSAIVYPASSAVSGVAGPLNVYTAWYRVGSGQKWLRPRPWPWFSLYELNTPVPQQKPPYAWAQYGQGLAGSLYFNTPDLAYVIPLDTACYPIPLVDDTTVEAVPDLWTTAVPYYAAYLALLSAQTGTRTQEAQGMLQLYELFVGRARRFVTPEVLPHQYAQTPHPPAGQADPGGAA